MTAHTSPDARWLTRRRLCAAWVTLIGAALVLWSVVCAVTPWLPCDQPVHGSFESYPEPLPAWGGAVNPWGSP